MPNCTKGWWSKVEWPQVADTVYGLNKELAITLEQLSKSETAPVLIRVKYPFGEEIVSSGVFKFPCDCNGCETMIKDIVERTNIPLGLVLNNRVEVLTQRVETHQTEPLRLLVPGDLFGVFEVADYMHKCPVSHPWTLTAGARTVVPLWQFRNSDLQQAIKRVLDGPDSCHDPNNLHLSLELMPQKLTDTEGWHKAFWPILRTMARMEKPDWMVDLLLIDVDWNKLKPSEPLRAYLFETAWDQSRELRDRGQATSQHENEVVSRLFGIMRGEGVGFTPCIYNEELGPFAPIQNRLMAELLINRKKTTKDFPKIPLLLLPGSLSRQGIDSGQMVVYFSINNKFTEPLPDVNRYSQNWRTIAWDANKTRKTAINAYWPSLDCFSADTAISDSDAIALTNYKNRFFLGDFSGQLSLAREAGWPANIVYDDALTKKQEGFFVAFARIALKE